MSWRHRVPGGDYGGSGGYGDEAPGNKIGFGVNRLDRTR